MPKITVIVPVYNAEKTIKRAVNSITGQSFSDFELILVDDGSKDASGKLCDMLAKEDARIKVIHKQNAGVSAARNDGMKAASGEYIQFVDSDDYLPDNFLERMICTQEEYGRDTFVWCGLAIVSENGARNERVWQFEECDITETDRSALFKLSMQHLLNSPVNKLYHKEILEKYKLIMKADIRIAEDLLFNIEYLERIGADSKIVILNDLFYPYIQNGEVSLDNQYHPDYYDIHKKILKHLWNAGEDFGVAKEDHTLFYQRYWEYMMVAMQNYDRKECTLSKHKKNRMMGRILRDPFFQKSLKMKKKRMGRASYYSMRSRSALLYSLCRKVRK